MEAEASALDADQSTEGLSKEARRAARKASMQGGDTASDLHGAKERPQRRNRKLKQERHKNLSEGEQHHAAATSVTAAYRGKKGREKADNEAEAEAEKQLQACRRASRTQELRVSLDEDISL